MQHFGVPFFFLVLNWREESGSDGYGFFLSVFSSNIVWLRSWSWRRWSSSVAFPVADQQWLESFTFVVLLLVLAGSNAEVPKNLFSFSLLLMTDN